MGGCRYLDFGQFLPSWDSADGKKLAWRQRGAARTTEGGACDKERCCRVVLHRFWLIVVAPLTPGWRWVADCAMLRIVRRDTSTRAFRRAEGGSLAAAGIRGLLGGWARGPVCIGCTLGWNGCRKADIGTCCEDAAVSILVRNGKKIPSPAGPRRFTLSLGTGCVMRVLGRAVASFGQAVWESMETRGILADWSAVFYWRERRVACGGVSLCGRELRGATSRARTFLAKGRKPSVSKGDRIPAGCTFPLQTIVGAKSGRVTRRFVHSRICASVPDQSMVDAGEGFLAPCPEYCFMQMARTLHLVELVVLGFELCGTYVVMPGGKTVYGKPSLTTVAKLRSFVEAARGPGRPAALRAVAFVQDGSASPMETMLAMMLCMPVRLGGFGLPRPSLNHPVSVGGRRRGGVRYADVCWPEAGLICEYDSDEFHPDRQYGNDAQRRNELRFAGYSVIEVRKTQVLYYEPFFAMARDVASVLGKRLRLPKDFGEKHVGLRLRLLGRLRNPGLMG